MVGVAFYWEGFVTTYHSMIRVTNGGVADALSHLRAAGTCLQYIVVHADRTAGCHTGE